MGVCSAAPTISKVVPAGAMRGSECEVLVMGANLHEPQALFFEDGIVQQTKIESVNDKQFKVVLKVPEDAPFGNHRFRVRTKKGLSVSSDISGRTFSTCDGSRIRFLSEETS